MHNPETDGGPLGSLDGVCRILAETTEWRNKYEFALLKILHLTDHEMADGDEARRIAHEALGEVLGRHE